MIRLGKNRIILFNWRLIFFWLVAFQNVYRLGGCRNSCERRESLGKGVYLVGVYLVVVAFFVRVLNNQKITYKFTYEHLL